MIFYVIESTEKKYLEINGGDLIWHDVTEIYNATFFGYRDVAESTLLPFIEAKQFDVDYCIRRIEMNLL